MIETFIDRVIEKVKITKIDGKSAKGMIVPKKRVCVHLMVGAI